MILTIIAMLLTLIVGIVIGSVVTKHNETKKFEAFRAQRSTQIDFNSYRDGYDDGARDGVIEYKRKQERDNQMWNNLISRFEI